MPYIPYTIVDRSIKAIERSVKNKFKWSWLEEKDEHGDYLSLYIRKIDVLGCVICDI
jgi:hypothetical protein